MWKKAVTYLTYKLKEIEFKYHTWRKASDIRKAYHTRERKKLEIPNLSGYFRKAARVGSGAVIVFAVVFGLYTFIPMIPFSQITNTVRSSAHDFFSSIERQRATVPSQTVTSEAHNTTPDTADVMTTTASVRNSEPVKRDAAVDTATESAPLIERFIAALPLHGLREHLLLADKSQQTLYLIANSSSGWDVVRTYRMTTGEIEGPKQVENDRKTPQGLYFIIGRKESSELSEIYGPLAYVLNYPNTKDQKAGRTGSGIWIHGTERGNSPPEPTRGCISLSNSDTQDLGSILQWGYGVPVFIADGDKDIRFDAPLIRQLTEKQQKLKNEFNAKARYFEDIVTAWRDAWQSKDIETFATFYSTDIFRSGRSDWYAFRANKVRTFAMYDWIQITVDNFILTELSPTEAIVKFSQTYQTNLNRFVNGKRLDFVKDGERWRISRENTFPQQELFL